MVYIYSDKTRATDMLATFFDDGANLPDVANRRLRHSIPVPSNRSMHGSELKRILNTLEADGIMRIGRAA